MPIYDKTILLICCSILYISLPFDTATVVPILFIITCTSLLTFLESKKLKLLVFISYCFLSFLFDELIFFFPVLWYDMFFSVFKGFIPLGIIAALTHYSSTSLTSYSLVITFSFLAYLICSRTQSLLTLRKHYTGYQDASKELALALEYKNKELLEKQDYEIHVATLNERNRIARDIHDHVGHMLSRCLLQVGALITLTKDPILLPHLKAIQETLTQGMNCIRESIHNLYNDSTPLSTEIQTLVDDFIFCPISLHYTMDDHVPTAIKYAFIAIVKEGLSNIIRHSSATTVTLTLRTHPAFYQLILHDNGSSQCYDFEKGIGLKNIHKRISSLNGTFSVHTEQGFKIFITIPKEAP